MSKKKVTLLTIIIAVILLALLFTIGFPNSETQSDARYSSLSLAAPPSTKAYDGTSVALPEGLSIPYDEQTKTNEIRKYRTDENIDINGARYIVHMPSKVHASSTIEGLDSFLVDLEVSGSELYPTGTNAGIDYSIYIPSGLYATDLREKTQEQSDNEDSTEQSYTRTFEIPYDGDGIYTFEICDTFNSKAYHVPMKISLM